MKHKPIILILLTLLITATMLPVTATLNPTYYNTPIYEEEYRVTVTGNFLGYYVNIENMAQTKLTQNDSIMITIQTIGSPAFVLLGRTLELEEPLPPSEETYHIGPLFGLGLVNIAVEVNLTIGGDPYYNENGTKGLLLLFTIQCEDIEVIVPEPY